MLAQIAEEIHAPDRAAQGTEEGHRQAGVRVLEVLMR
jgi:hypothetical protein